MQGVFNLDRSVKAILAGAIAVTTAIASGYDDGFLTSSEKALAVGAGIVALAGVWAFENVIVKAAVAALIAGATTLAAGLADDAMSAQEWVTLIVAMLVAFGVIYKVPNVDGAPEPAPPPVTATGSKK
jgi:hypothetical protein